jgi:ribosomal protein L11 methyltransferase
VSKTPLLKISVESSLEAEEPILALLETISGVPASSYYDNELGTATVSVYLETASDWSATKLKQLEKGLQTLKRSGVSLGTAAIKVSKLPRENWAESWKKHFKPQLIRNKLWVRPSWTPKRLKPGQFEIVLDPGLSFGTGQHPTTRFCLEEVVREFRANTSQSPSFLDLGTGSGILAIAAAKLGYQSILALDFDPEAIRVARDNAKANHVSRKIRIKQQDLTLLPQISTTQYDLICANLIDELLLSQKERIINRLKSGGTLVLAGILQRQFKAVEKAYCAAGLKLCRTASEKEWQSGSFEKPLSGPK